MGNNQQVETWSAAMTRALYGPDGFYTAHRRGPGSDYRTSSSASPAFARAVLELLRRTDAALGHPDELCFVEVASASGGLISAVREQAEPTLRARTTFIGVDLAARPAGLDPAIEWSEVPPPLTGLLFANEWLDNVPVDVVERTESGLSGVLVGTHGVELLGDAPSAQAATWLETWWPLEHEGDRAEIGTERDRLWAQAVQRLERGYAVTADYCTYRDDREAGVYPMGTLVGYRDGATCDPRVDGTSDITAHVAIDAVAHAGVEPGGAQDTLLLNQRAILKRLGISGARPDVALATTDPQRYLIELTATSEQGELLDPGGLGALMWLLQSKGCTVADLGL